jgi:catechol 2,3-dioxygenase-like lactoylglutathione lyase family enzyme
MQLLKQPRPREMPPLRGILETSLYVRDVPRSARFYQDIFGFQTLTSDARFHALDVAGQGVLLLFDVKANNVPSVAGGGIIPSHGGSGQLHLAFAIPAGSADEWEKWVTQRGIPLESRVAWPRGAVSLYLRDLDEHLIELVTPGLWEIY